MPVGQEFIKHEFDEAIAIQEKVVEAARQLADAHPLPEMQQALKRRLPEGEKHLKELRRFGERFGATGELEDVAEGMTSLMDQTLGSAQDGGEVSEAYEAHAVLLSLKRKQQDSSISLMRIAKTLGDKELQDAAVQMNKEIKDAAEELAGGLADFAVQIATEKYPGVAGAASA